MRVPQPLSTDPKPSDLSKPPTGGSTVPANSRDDEICIVAEKEGIRSAAARPVSNTSDHSIHRLNGLVDDRPSSRQSIIHRNSPVVTGGGVLKSDSPAVRGGAYGLPPTSLPSSYYSRSHLLPPSAAAAAYGLPAHHLAGSAAMAAYAQAQDPRLMGAHHAAAMLRPPANPFDPMAAAYASAAQDPFRDPYRAMDMFRDPLREARERELIRISELDRAKVNIYILHRSDCYYMTTVVCRTLIHPCPTQRKLNIL